RPPLRRTRRATGPLRRDCAAGRPAGLGPPADPAAAAAAVPGPRGRPGPGPVIRPGRGRADGGGAAVRPAVVIVVLAGAGGGLGMFLVLRGLAPGVPALGPALRQLHAPTAAAGRSGPAGGPLGWLASRLRVPHRELALIGHSPERYIVEKVG